MSAIMAETSSVDNIVLHEWERVGHTGVGVPKVPQRLGVFTP